MACSSLRYFSFKINTKSGYSTGSIGGTMEACFLQPIDTIKTRLQLDSQKRYTGLLGCWTVSARMLRVSAFAFQHQHVRALCCCLGIWNCGSTIIKEEGVRSLWKGLTPFAVHLTLKYALRMGTNAFYQSLLRDKVKAALPVNKAQLNMLPTVLLVWSTIPVAGDDSTRARQLSVSQARVQVSLAEAITVRSCAP